MVWTCCPVMPRMSGIELYKWVREEHPGIKMILVTGYPLGDSTRQLLEEGKAVWLQKPFDSATLGSKVASLLRGAGQTSDRRSAT